MGKINIDTWKRKAQYDFFKSFEQPFFNVTANVNITSYTQFLKAQQQPFFLGMLHAVLTTVNQLSHFRYRLQGDDVWEYETIHSGITILKEDETFMYCTVLYEPFLATFIQNSQQAIAAQKAKRGFVPHTQPNVIYVSSLPWISFTSVQHAHERLSGDSIPRFVFGKFFQQGDQLLLPLAVEVHHALADGFHVGQFFEKLQKHLNDINL